MISKIGKGKNFAGLFRYLYGPAKKARDGRTIETHENPHIIASNMPDVDEPKRDARYRCGYDVQPLVRAMLEVAATNKAMKHTVWHTSLSAAPEDLAAGKMRDDESWRVVAEGYMTAMGLSGNGDPMKDVPWLAIRHGETHVHIVASRVRYDGYAIDDSFDRPKSMRVLRDLERRHGLADPDAKSRRVSRTATVTRTERELTQRKNAVRARPEQPVRLQLADKVRAAVRNAGGSVDRFHALLESTGVLYRPSVARNGRVNGYTFGAVGEVDRQGNQRWYRGSKLARDLRWGSLADKLDHDPNAWRSSPGVEVTLSEREPGGQERRDLSGQERGAAPPADISDDPAEARRQLAQKVLRAASAADGQSERFHTELEAAGVVWRANVASTGRMNGYAFAYAGAEGEVDATTTWYGGSKLHKSLAWSKLGPLLTGDQPPRKGAQPGTRPVNRSVSRGAGEEGDGVESSSQDRRRTAAVERIRTRIAERHAAERERDAERGDQAEDAARRAEQERGREGPHRGR